MGFTTEPTEIKPAYSGTQRLYQFDNGYGASVIQHEYSYGGESGLWELAVLAADGSLAYDTPVTSDVEGRLSEGDVEELLAEIKALPAVAS